MNIDELLWDIDTISYKLHNRGWWRTGDIIRRLTRFMREQS